MTDPATIDGTADRPIIICLMTSSLDGRLHPSRWTTSPDGDIKAWSVDYERIHDALAADGWIVGRTTMAEMATGEPHPPGNHQTPPRPHHLADQKGPFAIGLDRAGKLQFASPKIGGDHVVVLLGRDVPDSHLAELVANGVSYLVATDEAMSLAPLLATLRREFGVTKLMLEGGGHINGVFLAAGLVDEFHLVLAPTLDGSPGTAIVEAGEGGLKGKVALSLKGCEVLESGAVHLRYTVGHA